MLPFAQSIFTKSVPCRNSPLELIRRNDRFIMLHHIKDNFVQQYSCEKNTSCGLITTE